MPDDLVIARNPDQDSTLPYIVRIPLGAGILLKSREIWPRTAKVYCHRVEEWPEGAEVVERVPVRSCVRRGAAIDLVLDRGREDRSQFVITTVRGRQAIFWQTARTAKQARPRVATPKARAQGISGLEIVVDSHERYAWTFAEQQASTRRRSLPAGDYGVLVDDTVVAVVERKGLQDLVSSLTSGKLKYQPTDLAVPRAAVHHPGARAVAQGSGADGCPRGVPRAVVGCLERLRIRHRSVTDGPNGPCSGTGICPTLRGMPEDRGPRPAVPKRWRVYQGRSPKDAEPEPAAESTTQTAPKPPRPGVRSGSKVVASLLAVGVLVGAVGLGAAVFAMAGDGSDDPQTAEGFQAMLADLKEETGSTLAFEAVVYPEYGVLTVPYAADDRSVGYRWDGGLDEWTKGTSSYQPFDLAEVDPTLIAGLCGPVLAMMEDPGDCYIIIRRPADLGTGAWFSVYASNEFSQTGWIEYTLDGTEVARHEP